MFHSRLKWLSLVAICVSILVSSAAGQQTRRTPPPVPQSEQDTVNKIKELMRQIDALMGKLPPNIQNQLKTELDGPAGLPSRELPPGPPTRGLPPEQEAVKREILSLKGEMDELLSKLPKDTQAQLRQEMAQPPESPQPPEGPHPADGRPDHHRSEERSRPLRGPVSSLVRSSSPERLDPAGFSPVCRRLAQLHLSSADLSQVHGSIRAHRPTTARKRPAGCPETIGGGQQTAARAGRSIWTSAGASAAPTAAIGRSTLPVWTARPPDRRRVQVRE